MYENNLSSEERKQRMKEKRMALYQVANEQLELVTSDASTLLSYLRLQAYIGYDVTNTLLVMNVNPNAVLVKDYSRWKESGYYPKEKQKGIPIIAPSKEYIKRDGSTGVNYNIKYVFDVTQTTCKESYPVFPDKEILLFGISYKSDIKTEYVDNTAHLNKSICYDKLSNMIYIQKGLPIDDVIRGLFREYILIDNAHADSLLKGERFSISCVLYMLCCKYGIDPVNTKFSLECADFFNSKDIKIKKAILKNINSVFDHISKRIDQGIFAQTSQQEMG